MNNYRDKHLIDVSENNELPPEYQAHLDGVIDIPCYTDFMKSHEVSIQDKEGYYNSNKIEAIDFESIPF